MRRAGMSIVGVIIFAQSLYAADFSAGLMAGYKGGLGFKATGMVSNFARGFPLSFEVGIAHTRLDPGVATVARKVFINDATNGTPEESGYIWDFRLDFLYRIPLFGMQNAHAFIGVRKAMFSANFKFIGGNEFFEITSDPWGWGAGLKADFPMGSRVSFSLSAGFDHYPSTALNGHDTVYSPNGENINGRKGYDYTSADDAINQPKFVPILMGGITVGF